MPATWEWNEDKHSLADLVSTFYSNFVKNNTLASFS